MAYSDFKSLRQLKNQFGINDDYAKLFQNITPIEPSDYLKNDLEEALDIPSSFSEKAKSELIITPILKELRRKNKHFNFFSGYSFDVDISTGLNGFCDYLMSHVAKSIEIKAPVFCIVEAKNRTVEEGYAQAGAEMIAARKFNDGEGLPTPIIYGCVTNAEVWSFLKLEGNTLFIDEVRYYSTNENIAELLGVMLYIINQYD